MKLYEITGRYMLYRKCSMMVSPMSRQSVTQWRPLLQTLRTKQITRIICHEGPHGHLKAEDVCTASVGVNREVA
ncbi:MAG: hypothetical protein ACLT46_14970 [Hungatella sp.]